MRLYIVRHAIAEERDPEMWPDDGLRPLTADGKRKFRDAARGLQRIAPEVDVLLTSPYVRTRETAEILELATGWPIAEPCDELMPGFEAPAVVDALRDRGGDVVAVVGHEPGLSELASYLLTGDPMSIAISFKKGATLSLVASGGLMPSGCELDWLMQPRTLRRLAI